MAMHISRITEADIQATYELVFSHMTADERHVFRTNNPDVYRSVIDILNSKYGICFVAKSNNQIIGYLMAAGKSNNSSNVKYAELRDMRVQKDYQGKGIGGLLVNRFILWAKANGYERLSVDVSAVSKKNIGFYQKFGFIPKTLTMEYWFD